MLMEPSTVVLKDAAVPAAAESGGAAPNLCLAFAVAASPGGGAEAAPRAPSPAAGGAAPPRAPSPAPAPGEAARAPSPDGTGGGSAAPSDAGGADSDDDGVETTRFRGTRFQIDARTWAGDAALAAAVDEADGRLGRLPETSLVYTTPSGGVDRKKTRRWQDFVAAEAQQLRRFEGAPDREEPPPKRRSLPPRYEDDFVMTPLRPKARRVSRPPAAPAPRSAPRDPNAPPAPRPRPNWAHVHDDPLADDARRSAPEYDGEGRLRAAREVRELVKCESQTLNLRQVRAALATGPATTQVDHGRLGGMLAGRIGENEYLTQYATDNRSKCKLISCKKAILLGELRIGKIPPRVNNEKANKRVHWHRPARTSTAGSGRRDHALQRSSSVDVDVADSWTHRWLSSSARSAAEEAGPNRSMTPTLTSS